MIRTLTLAGVALAFGVVTASACPWGARKDMNAEAHPAVPMTVADVSTLVLPPVKPAEEAAAATKEGEAPLEEEAVGTER